MSQPVTIDRRRFLRATVGASAGVILLPGHRSPLLRPPAGTAPGTAATDPLLPFVDHYRTNLGSNLSADTNAAADILSGMARLWRTGSAWDNGLVLDADVLRRNMRYCADVTRHRTADQAKTSFIYDRQHQSYAVIDGLGPLADLYRRGSLAVTGITSAPDGTPPTRIDDAVPAGAPAGSALGAGSPTSDLGLVVTLVNTVRGSYSSGNPSKFTYQYPRPWRMTEDSTVVDTGAVDAFGYPVYRCDVVVAPQLLRQRSTDPAGDGGFPSGHTNAFFLAALALAYAIPERFQELVTRAFELADTRILAGMHSPVDVVGGRILATALTAAILNDPTNAELKAAARSQAAGYLQARTGTTATTLIDYAHAAGTDTDPYADRRANARAVAPRFSYILPRRGRQLPMTVPAGAEVLLETRLPYLDADQRREVLRTTALPSGYPLLDGPELWGRLNLFAAADGYGAFDADVRVVMAAEAGGFHAADTWRNDIGGRGGLVQLGTGTLTLTGTNRFTGGTQVRAGTLVAGSSRALGRGGVRLTGGTLQLAACDVRVPGDYRQSDATLQVTAGPGPALLVGGTARIGSGSALVIRLGRDGHGIPRPHSADHNDPGHHDDHHNDDPGHHNNPGHHDDPDQVGLPHDGRLPVIRAGRLQGRFASIAVDVPGYRVRPEYDRHGLMVRISRR